LLCCGDCDDRRTRSIGRWQWKCLWKQLIDLGFDSNIISLWNGSFHDVSFLCIKPLFIFLLQQDYPTNYMSVIESLYWNAAPKRIVNHNFHFLYAFTTSFLSSFAVWRDCLAGSYNSSFWSAPRCLLFLLVTREMVREFSCTLMHRRFTRELPKTTT
jgi:hypothetical protein